VPGVGVPGPVGDLAGYGIDEITWEEAKRFAESVNLGQLVK